MPSRFIGALCAFGLCLWVHAQGPASAKKPDWGVEIDPGHWSLRPVTDPTPPDVAFIGQVRNPIDQFVISRLQESNLAPAPEADRRTLIRRVYQDMHGLLPAPEEIEAFLKDQDEGAYERLIERVLKSPRFGERWARHWLDLVRYADTRGFEVNRERPNAWPYRDYVIAAFNRDLPYDRFILEQLAGDAVEADAATGFLVAGPHNTTVGSAPGAAELARQDELADIVNATGTTFLGLTMGCARCHAHKFDPITHQDYYSFQALLEGVQHADRPLPEAVIQERKDRIETIDRRLEEVRSQLNPYKLPLREPVDAQRNEERFPPTAAKTVRLTVSATNDGEEPAIDELEVYAAAVPATNQMFARKEFLYMPKVDHGGLLAHWTFDTARDDLAVDAVGGYNGRIAGATRVAGRIGSGALRFDGQDDYVDLGIVPQLALVGSAYTFAWWAKPDGGGRMINMNDNLDHSGGYSISLAGTDLALQHDNERNNNVSDAAPLALGKWQHVAVVYDETAAARRIYVDGRQVKTLPVEGGALTSDGDDPLWFGGTKDDGQFFTGELDDVRIYNQSLALEQIEHLAEMKTRRNRSRDFSVIGLGGE